MEVPAILYQLEDYKSLIDFISVGTNDLIQYVLAVDRNSNMVGHLYSGLHPAVLRLLKRISEKSIELCLEVSICGELAGTPTGALAMIALGYEKLSISPSHIPMVRFLAHRLDPDITERVRRDILVMRKNSQIQRYLIETLESIHPALIEIE